MRIEDIKEALRAKLKKVNFERAHLENANLWSAQLEDANLERTYLVGANLNKAQLHNSNLKRAHLENAKLFGAYLKNADLLQADISGADLRIQNPSELRLDDTRILKVRFAPGSSDPWSVLRRGYSGPALFFHLLFLIAFLLPYLGRAAYWKGVNTAQGTFRVVQVKTGQFPHKGRTEAAAAGKVNCSVPSPRRASGPVCSDIVSGGGSSCYRRRNSLRASPPPVRRIAHEQRPASATVPTVSVSNTSQATETVHRLLGNRTQLPRRSAGSWAISTGCCWRRSRQRS